MSITPSIVASRTTLTAGGQVFFDASGTTSTFTSRPFHECLYIWDFDDPGSGTFTRGTGVNTSRNAATGPLACHVYKSAGTYTVTLTVFDGETLITDTETITVNAYSGSTLIVSQDGDFTDAPAGDQTTNGDFDAVVNNNKATYKRIAFKNGNTFSANVTTSLNQASTLIICDWASLGYATTTRPIVNAANGSFLFFTATQDDARVVNLDLRRNGQTGVALLSAIGTDFQLLDGCLYDGGAGADYAIWFGDLFTDTPSDNLCLSDTAIELGSSTVNLMFGGGGVNMAIIGSRLDTNSLTTEHNLRIAQIKRLVIDNSELSGCASIRSVLKLGAYTFSTDADISEYIVISNTVWTGEAGDFTVGIGPQNETSDERVRHVIYEKNFNQVGAGQQVAAIFWAQDVTVRNNLVVTTGGLGPNCLQITRRGVEPVPTRGHFYHNTMFCNSTFSEGFGITLSTGTSHRVQNNLAYFPNISPTVGTFDDTATGSTVNGNNTATSNPTFVNATPTVIADFELASGSNCRNIGTDDIPVFDDYKGQIRDWEGNVTDAGFRAFTTGELPAAIGVIGEAIVSFGGRAVRVRLT